MSRTNKAILAAAVGFWSLVGLGAVLEIVAPTSEPWPQPPTTSTTMNIETQAAIKCNSSIIRDKVECAALLNRMSR